MANYKKCNLVDINIVFTPKEEAKKLITTRDSYINNLTKLDLDCRCHKRRATLDEYLQLCENSVLDFTEKESLLLTYIIAEVDSELKRRGMMLPFVENINLVKTSGDEENNAVAYTRGNTIYITNEAFKVGDGFAEHMFVHELFHVLTRNCTEFKKAIYKIIGYTVEDKFFDYPLTALGSFISNPDVCNQVCHAKLKVDGMEFDTIVLTFSRCRSYKGGAFKSYSHPHFFVLDDNHEFKRDEHYELMVFQGFQMADSYFEHIGRNTRYCINPEEALAENFVIAVLGTQNDLPNPEIIDSIRKTMHYRA